jgi:hypothetical protein
MAVLDVEKGLEELKTKSLDEIERATAVTWGGRAAASYQLAMDARGMAKRFRHFYEGETYRQEALEHASMAEDGGKLLTKVRDEVDSYRLGAMGALNIKA